MASTIRAGPPVLLRAMASSTKASHGGVTWHRAGTLTTRHGALRQRGVSPSAAAPRAARLWGSQLSHPRRNPSAFRLFAGGADGPAGPTSDDEGTATRDWFSELTWMPPLDPTKVRAVYKLTHSLKAPGFNP
jgi:hypothetical protein